MGLKVFEEFDFLSGVGSSEDGATGNEGVGTSLYELLARGAVDAAVDLDEGVAAAFCNHRAEALHLLEALGNELLTAETGVDAHKEDKVNVGNDVFEHADGSGGVEGNTSLHAFGVDLLDDTVEVGAGFVVNGHVFGTEGGNLVDKLLGLHDHEVHVERLCGVAGNCLKHGEAKTDVGHEYAVHYVEVNPLAGAVVEHLGIAFDIAEVGAEH